MSRIVKPLLWALKIMALKKMYKTYISCAKYYTVTDVRICVAIILVSHYLRF
jgi:hypothetical protein